MFFFVDFKAAFDTIDRNALMYKMYRMGMSYKFGRVLQNLYMETKAAVWDGENISQWFETQTGVRQGCKLSPNLFALFIDDITDCLPGGIEYTGTLIKALLFADDIVLFAYSPQSLQLMINKLSEYCRTWRLVVSLEKSKVMVFRRGGGRASGQERWTFNSERIEVVNEYKYLGIYITKNNNMERHLTEKLQKAKTTMNIAWKNIFNNRHIAHSSKYKVFESVAESTLMYAAQVWGSKRYETAEKLLRFYIKRIFKLPPNTPNYMLMLESGISPIFIKTLKLQVDYICNVFNMPDDRLPKKAALQAINNKTSWFRDWIELAEEANIELVPEEYLRWKPTLYQMIAIIDDRLRLGFAAEAKESMYRMIYNKLNYNLNQKNYFRDDYSTDQISMVFRLRGELLNLNFIPHRDELPLLCELCNMKERENIVHFLGRCPVLRETRRHIFGCDFLSEELTIHHLNEVEVPKLYKYCKIALEYRKRIINGSF